ncbi:hypothetical protein TNCV_3520121 [Trichonephila clavipes]|nr:hypothetical protein TNCV_3520121 [Trichonephila clavipes]
MATGSSLTQNHYRSQSEIQGDLHKSLAPNGPVADSRDLNLVFGHTEATHNKLFFSSPTKYTVEPSWILVRVWPPFELRH